MCAAPSHDDLVKARSRRSLDPAYLLGGAILLAFIAFVQWYIGWGALLRPWTGLSFAAVGVAAALVMASYVVRALRLYDYFRDRMRRRFHLALKLTLQHNLWNNMLPMRTGEAAFPLLMSRYFDIPLMKSVAALLWFRVLDMHTLVACALAALGGLWLNTTAAATLLVVWMALPWAGYRLGMRHAERLGQSPPGGRLSRLLHHVVDSLPPSSHDFWRAWGWTLVNWAVKFAGLVWVLQQFIHGPVAAAVLGVIAGDTTSVLPIHGVAGAGTYEAGIVAGLAAAAAGIPAQTAVAGAVNVHLFILSAAVLGGALSLCLPGRRRRG
jgi:uncharacterized membrane protein YbhN (UPF0104 family)